MFDRKNHSLCCPWKKTHSLVGWLVWECLLFSWSHQCHPVQSESPLWLGFLPVGGGFYAYQVVPVVSLLSVSQYFNSVTTVLSLACTGLLQCGFACRAKSVLSWALDLCLCLWPEVSSSGSSSSSIPPEQDFTHLTLRGWASLSFAIRMRYVQKVWIKFPQVVRDLKYSCESRGR